MELIDDIKNRKSIRKYKDKKVSKEIIEDLINCARLAPSAKNRQPWKFVVVQEDLKNKIADLMLEKESKIKIKNSVKQTALVIKQAPILILVLREKNNDWIIGDALSIGAAVEHICLRATDLGLGSLWIRDTIYIQEEIAELICHEDMEVNCAISVGYADNNPSRRLRKELNEILEWYE